MSWTICHFGSSELLLSCTVEIGISYELDITLCVYCCRLRPLYAPDVWRKMLLHGKN